ncbi:UvrD-helicase domain-containing protein [Salinicola halophyticus]|uniref:UvrD-helicase domain-containing protein n=1 Tax=Salinicola halophyticus TaxID=1808881 RepID=UPI003F4706FB
MSTNVELGGNERDAHVVEDICGYVTAAMPRSFFLFAGAGSGKTRTLVEVLRRITGVVEHQAGSEFAKRLRSRGQTVRVITYTKNATAVVSGRLGENHLTVVSTIHSFCWELIQGFDGDIRDALLALNADDLLEAKAAASAKKRGETDTDRKKYAKIEEKAVEISSITKFLYHPDKTTHGPGALSHTNVLEIAAWLINNRPTLRRILEDRHPLVLIDESQDTMKSVLDALLAVAEERPGRFHLGLLGDHRQRIYFDGHRDLPSHIPDAWAVPALKMNHRSQKRIVDLINAIWEVEMVGRTQPKTGFAQHPRKEKSGGIVRIFIGDANLTTESKVEKEMECAHIMAQITGQDAWSGADRGYKTLALEHKLAAKRGRFLDAYSAMQLLDKDAVNPKGNGERSGPGMVRPLLGSVLDLEECVDTVGRLDEFYSMEVLRQAATLANLPDEIAERRAALDKIDSAVAEFAMLTREPGSTVRDVMRPLLEADVFEVDARLLAAFNDDSAPPPAPVGRGNEDKEAKRRRGWCALFDTAWGEIGRYRQYLHGEAELATHQVVKGSEFPHVMVVMDDLEAKGSGFSYERVFGIEELSKSDLKNIEEGDETSVDRTLRLLYVTCSRAEESLALVLWSTSPEVAEKAILKTGWFERDEISMLA